MFWDRGDNDGRYFVFLNRRMFIRFYKEEKMFAFNKEAKYAVLAVKDQTRLYLLPSQLTNEAGVIKAVKDAVPFILKGYSVEIHENDKALVRMTPKEI